MKTIRKGQEVREVIQTVDPAVRRVRDQRSLSLGENHPLARDTSECWEVIAERVYSRCRARLAPYPSIDPRDVAQEVLVELQKRSFGKKFDPRRTPLWGFIEGVIRHKSQLAVRQYGRYPRANLDVLDGVAREEFDPSHAAERSELREAMQTVAKELTSTERLGLARMLVRAEHGPQAWGCRKSTVHVREFRCRARLRHLLRGHR